MAISRRCLRAGAGCGDFCGESAGISVSPGSNLEGTPDHEQRANGCGWSSADSFFILALTDLRPIAEKYFRRVFEITQSFYHAQRLSITEYRFIPRCSVFVPDL